MRDVCARCNLLFVGGVTIICFLLGFDKTFGEGFCAIQNNKKYVYYDHHSIIKCLNFNVSLSSYCVTLKGSKNAPFCFSQVVNFVNETNYTAKSELYEHLYRGGEPDFIAKMECISDKSKSLIILRGTNFANCSVCEWIDVFSVEGDYIGSSSKIYKDEHHAKKLDKIFEDEIYSDHFIQSSFADIDRNP